MVFRRIPTTWAWEPGQAPKRKEAGGVWGERLDGGSGAWEAPAGVHTEATRADLTPFTEHLMGPHLGGLSLPSECE